MIFSLKCVSEHTERPVELLAFRHAVIVLISRYILLYYYIFPINSPPISETMTDDFLKRDLRGQTRATSLESAAVAGERKADTFKKSRVAAPCCCVVRVSSPRLTNFRLFLNAVLQPNGDGHFNLIAVLSSRATVAPKSFITLETDAKSSAAFRQA